LSKLIPISYFRWSQTIRLQPWRLSDAPDYYIDTMLAHVSAFEIAIQTITGKWKLSQNHSEENQIGVYHALRDRGQFGDSELAEMLKLENALSEHLDP